MQDLPVKMLSLLQKSGKFRIRKMRVTSVALVPAGANDMPVLYKSADATASVSCLTKLNDERGELLAVVYAPDRVDSQGHFADASVIRDAAHGWLSDGAAFDILHDGKKLSKERVSIAESFIVQPGDARFSGWKSYSGDPVNLEGAWAIVAKIHDPELRRLYREGRWNGVSLSGPALLEQAKSRDADIDETIEKLAAALKLRKEPQPSDDTTMTPEQLQAALAANNAELAKTLGTAIATSVATALAPVLEKALGGAKPAPAPEQQKPKAPDLTNPNDVANLVRAKRIEKLAAETDFDDPESLERYHQELVKIQGAKAGPAAKPKSSQPAGSSDVDLAKGSLTFEELTLLGKGMASLVAR